MDYDYTDGSKYYKAKYTEAKIKNWTLQPDGVYYMNPYCYYWSAANEAIYTFTAAEDVEVLVFSSNTGYKAMLDAVEIADGSNWVSMNYSESDCVKIYQASAMAFTNIAGRKVNKGETVTIYSPGKYSSHYLVFVRPIN